jgi:hypothetical protein
MKVAIVLEPFRPIDYFDEYFGVPTSVCFEKAS